ncbi:hypothetical protein N7527_006983 [Penicillium freii]|nr:hypothetical protein N7527_006983 [Penicillium freii]
MKQPNTIPPKVVTPTVPQENDAENSVLVLETARTTSKEVKAAYKLGQQKKKAATSPAKGPNPEAPSDAQKRAHQSKKARKKELAHVVEELGKANLEPADSGQSRASSVSVAPSAHPSSGAKIQKTKPPKRARKTSLLEDGALQRFTSGTWVVLKPTSFSPTEDSFLAAVTGIGNALKALPEQDLSGPEHVEIRKKL